MDCKKLKFIQCNVNRCYLSQTELMRHDFDVALVSEPYTGKYLTIQPIHGVDILQFGNSVDRVKAAILIKKNRATALGMSQLSTPNLAVAKVDLGPRKLLVASIYIEPDEDKINTIIALDHLLHVTSGKDVVVGGDLNGKHPEWEETSINERGEEIMELVATHLLNVANIGKTPTFEAIRHGGHCSSIVDITLISDRLIPIISKWKVCLDACPSSDHNAISFEISHKKPKRPQQAPIRKYKTKNEKFTEFKDHFTQNFETHNYTNNNIQTLQATEMDNLIEELTKTIQESCDKTLKSLKNNNRHNPWWSDDLERLKKTTIKAHHRIHDLKKSKRPIEEALKHYHELKTEYAKTLLKTSTENFRDFCNKQVKEDVWSITNRIIKTTSAMGPLQTLKVNSQFTTNFDNTAHALLNHFYPDDNEINETTKQKELRNATNQNPNTDDDLPFTEEEIRDHLTSMNPNKAPGLDHLTADICLEVFNIIPSFITQLLNRCLEIGHFPNTWKRALVVIIPKPGKTDTSDMSSYRPIGLIQVFGKLLEKLFAKRLTYHLDVTEQNNNKQFGFKEQKSTTDALQIAIDYINEAKQQKLQIVGVSLDIKAAFDSAWWPLLLHRLRKTKCPKNIYKLIKSYLEDRTATLRYGTATAQKTLTKGCIQGSVCGPIFWNLILDQLLEMTLPPNTQIQAYADDVFLLVRGKTPGEIEQTTNDHLQKISDWGTDAKLKFGANKTKVISFSRKAQEIRITMDNTPIPLSQDIKLLGVTIDNKLTFITHCRNIINKTTKLHKKLAYFIKPTWGAHPQNAATIYKHVITPMFTYAAGIWGGATKYVCVRVLLRRLQRQFAIRTIRAFRTVSAVTAITLAGFTPLHLIVNEAKEIHKVKYTGTYTTLPDDITLRRNIHPKNRLHPAKRISIKYTEALTNEEIDTQTAGSQIKIFTDGSKQHNGDTGAGVVIYLENQDQPIKIKKRLNRTTTVFISELYAIETGLKWLNKYLDKNDHHRIQHVSVATDSQSALKALQDRNNPDPTICEIHRLLHGLDQALIKISFVWVKAHAGIAGNEMADQTANAAATGTTTIVSRLFPISYAKRDLKRRTESEWHTLFNEEALSSHLSVLFDHKMEDIGHFLSKVSLTFAWTQILTNHGYHKEYLHRFKITDNNTCPCDDTSVQSLDHLLRECPIFALKRHDHLAVCGAVNLDPYKIPEIIKKDSTLNSYQTFITNIVNNLKQINGT